MPGAQIVESVSFLASEAYLADGSLADKVTSYLKKAKGCLSVFLGFQIQDPRRAYIFLIWESYEHFVKKEQRADYPGLLEDFKPLVRGSNWTIQHITFDEDPAAAFSAPITEFSLVKPQAGQEQHEIDSVIAQVQKAAPSVPGAHLPPAWGPVRGSVEYAMVAGWDSVEAHLCVVGVSPIDVLAAKLFELSDVVTKHVALHKA